MTSDLLLRYVRDARQAYQLCADSLGVPDPTDFRSLLWAARDHRVERKGQVTTKMGVDYTYHIHGLGYSFKEIKNNKHINFDVIMINGVGFLRFSLWKFHQYILSIGEPVSEAVLAADLLELSAKDKNVVRVLEGPHEYYYYTGRDGANIDIGSMLSPGGRSDPPGQETGDRQETGDISRC